MASDQTTPRWIDVAAMPDHPRGWYWAEFPGTWVFYTPEQHREKCIDHGDAKWHSPISGRYWGPWSEEQLP